MALFPQTTCFYKALISKPPASHMDEYEVLFEDPTYPEGFSPPLYVAQRYVIPFKQSSRASSANPAAAASNSSQAEGSSGSDSEEPYAK